MASAANSQGKLQHEAILPGSKLTQGRGSHVLRGSSIIHHMYVPVSSAYKRCLRNVDLFPVHSDLILNSSNVCVN